MHHNTLHVTTIIGVYHLNQHSTGSTNVKTQMRWPTNLSFHTRHKLPYYRHQVAHRSDHQVARRAEERATAIKTRLVFRPPAEAFLP